MTKNQELAATQLLRAFRKCHAADLSAAILDGRVCLWPKGIDVQGDDHPGEKCHEVGRVFTVGGMWLDGGAGV